MKLIVGLGNPGARYACTRHNAGFWVLDEIARRAAGSWRSKADAVFCELADVVLLKPQTFVNLSGGCVHKFARYRNIEDADILVVLDDLDMPAGRVRVRTQGTSGGHKGMRSIIERFGTHQIARIKLGIGRPPDGVDPADYVLMQLDDQSRSVFKRAVTEAADACLKVIEEGIVCAMNEFNGPQGPQA